MTVDIATMTTALEDVVGSGQVFTGEAISDDLTHDEVLGMPGVRPAAVVRPADTDQVAAVVAWASANGVPVTARGAEGLSPIRQVLDELPPDGAAGSAAKVVVWEIVERGIFADAWHDPAR